MSCLPIFQQTTEESLRAFFEVLGDVSNASVVREPQTQSSRYVSNTLKWIYQWKRNQIYSSIQPCCSVYPLTSSTQRINLQPSTFNWSHNTYLRLSTVSYRCYKKLSILFHMDIIDWAHTFDISILRTIDSPIMTLTLLFTAALLCSHPNLPSIFLTCTSVALDSFHSWIMPILSGQF